MGETTPAAFKKLLAYLYSDELELDDEVVVDVRNAARTLPHPHPARTAPFRSPCTGIFDPSAPHAHSSQPWAPPWTPLTPQVPFHLAWPFCQQVMRKAHEFALVRAYNLCMRHCVRGVSSANAIAWLVRAEECPHPPTLSVQP